MVAAISHKSFVWLHCKSTIIFKIYYLVPPALFNQCWQRLTRPTHEEILRKIQINCRDRQQIFLRSCKWHNCSAKVIRITEPYDLFHDGSWSRWGNRCAWQNGEQPSVQHSPEKYFKNACNHCDFEFAKTCQIDCRLKKHTYTSRCRFPPKGWHYPCDQGS